MDDGPDMLATSAEVLIVTMALTAALLPLITRAWKRRSAGVRAGLVAAGVVWLLTVSSLGNAWLEAERVAETAPGRPVEVRSDGYVSSQACQACHPDQYASWRRSYHRTMTQLATPESVRPRFDGSVLQERHRYQLERRGDEFWVVTDDPTWAPGEPLPVQRRIVLVTGSHHEQGFWFETGQGRRLGRFPFFYRLPEQRWVPIHAALLAQASTDLEPRGRWNGVCIRCHATHGVPKVAERERPETEVTEFGIACEACHGPGGEHARRQRDPLRRYAEHLGFGGDDDSIVNPATLDAERAVDVCAQCHSVYAFRDVASALRWTEGDMPYRPGDVWSDAVHVFAYGQGPEIPAVKLQLEANPHFFEERFWSDGAVALIGREANGVRDSPCFAGGDFACTSCHALHRRGDDPRSFSEWADDQLGAGMRGDEACLQCHERFRGAIGDHTHHDVASQGSRCLNCHMPHTAYGLMKAERSHRIESPDTAVDLATGRPNACNLCHLDQTLAWTAAHLETWYGTPQPTFDDRERTRVAEGLLVALRGDAGRRALMAWHMGWPPAREASGTGWMVPVLSELMLDPYPAIREIAWRAMRATPGYEELAFDYIAPPESRRAARDAARAQWADRARPEDPPQRAARLLLESDGGLDEASFARLLATRDDRRVYRAE